MSDDLKELLKRLKGEQEETNIKVFDVSIDMVRLVSNFIRYGQNTFQRLINNSQNPKIKLYSGGYNGHIGDSVYWETNKLRSVEGREFTLEWNPNKITQVEKDFLFKEILPLLKQVSFTRIDIAFDVNEDLSSFLFFEEKNGKKQRSITGRSGVLETLDIGLGSTEHTITIYNKREQIIQQIRKNVNKLEKLENKKQGYEKKLLELEEELEEIEKKNKKNPSKENEEKKENVIQQINYTKWLIERPTDSSVLTYKERVVENDIKKTNEHENWWRIEFKLKGRTLEGIEDGLDEKTLFRELNIIKPSYKNFDSDSVYLDTDNKEKKVTKSDIEQLFYYIHHPKELKEMKNWKKKKKLETLLKMSSSKNVIPALRHALVENMEKIENDYKTILSHTNINFYDYEKLLLTDEKHDLKNGIWVPPERLHFKDNVGFVKGYKKNAEPDSFDESSESSDKDLPFN